jgi:uncharacterized protein with gpF-like domain
MEEAGIQPGEAKKIWSATGDDRTRDDHMEMDGQEVGVDEAFETPGGDFLMFPGDSSLGAPPEQVANCRCAVEYNVDFIGRALRQAGF